MTKNNMIKREECQEQEALLEKLGYDESDLLNRQEVVVYQLDVGGNALAIAGFPGFYVAIDNVQVYSVYRNDKINDYANPVRLREQMHRRQTGEPEACDDWNGRTVVLGFGGEIRRPITGRLERT